MKLVGKRSKLASTLLAGGFVLACTAGIVSLAGPMGGVTISLSTFLRGADAIHAAVGNALQNMYGNAYNGVEVHIDAVRVNFGPGSTIVPFSKPCDKNFRQAGQDPNLDKDAYADAADESTDSTAGSTSGGGGGGDAGGSSPGAPSSGAGTNIPGPTVPQTTCQIMMNCTGTVIVG